MYKNLVFAICLVAMAQSAMGQIRFGKNRLPADSGPAINYASPKEYEIADIEVSGVEFLDNNALISLAANWCKV